MKKKYIIIALLLWLLIVLGIAGWKLMTDYSRILDANWGLSLPQKAGCEQVYAQDDSGAHGDGLRFHAFSYDEEQSIQTMLEWHDDVKTLYHESCKQAVSSWLDALAVPSVQRPDYESSRYWYQSQSDNSELIILWDDDKDLLYIVESFI